MTAYTGNTNNDTFNDSIGSDSFDGGAGIDRITANSDANFVLTNNSLNYGSFLTKTISVNSSTVNLPITDFATTTSALTVADTGFNVADVNVQLDITHEYDSDVEIHLVHGATDVLLAKGVGNLGQNFTNTTFDDEATSSINTASAPFTGSYTPQTPLTAFDNVDPTGDWQLKVSDNEFFSTGQLNSWALTVNAIAYEPNVLTSIEEGVLTGGAGDNKLDASAFSGSVTLDGGAGNDTLLGGSANDVLNGGDGFNTLDGGAGVDTLVNIEDVDMTLTNTALNHGFIQQNKTFSSGSVNKAITDNNATGIASNINVPTTGIIKDVNVTFDITHTYDADLIISLAHNSQSVVIANQIGSSSDNFKKTTVDDEASTNIINGSAPFTGTYQPQNTLTVFDNNSLSGTWSLNVSDNKFKDIGRLNSWSLNITYVNPITNVLNNIEQGILTGGASNNNLDASAFTLGSVLLSGLAGDDTLTGSQSNDTLSGGLGNDKLNGSAGNDYLTGEDGNDKLTGGIGADTLDGGLGNDALIGSAGNDIYIADANDVITELANEGTDTIQANTTWILTTPNVENITLLGTNAINATGTGFSKSASY